MRRFFLMTLAVFPLCVVLLLAQGPTTPPQGVPVGQGKEPDALALPSPAQQHANLQKQFTELSREHSELRARDLTTPQLLEEIAALNTKITAIKQETERRNRERQAREALDQATANLRALVERFPNTASAQDAQQALETIRQRQAPPTSPPPLPGLPPPPLPPASPRQ
jgi:hypothetical protein